MKKRMNTSSLKSSGISRASCLVLVLLFGCSFNSRADQAPTLERGFDLLKHGNYKDAGEVFRTLLGKNPEDVDAAEGLIRTQIETGDYANAAKRASELVGRGPVIRILLGEIEYQTGKYAEAASQFDMALKEAKGEILLRALLGKVRVADALGRVDDVRANALEFVRYYNSQSEHSAIELALIAQGVVFLEKFKDANDLFIDAREKDPTCVEAFVAQGELLNEKYNYGDAASLFQDALKTNPNSVRALLGLAVSKQDSGSEVNAVLDQALHINPNYPSALTLKARFDLENDKADASREGVEKALAINSASTEAIAIRAASLYLSNKKPEMDAQISLALGINPKCGELFATLAHFAVINRRYENAVEFGKRAVELSPSLWSARTDLGIQLLRVGRVAEGRAELERAFQGDPYNIWAKNTLDLLDAMRPFVDTVRGPFIVRAAPRDSGVIGAYAADLLEEAQRKLTAKYHFTPRPPITVEVFANHEDFAVRSLGLPGLGALGVCFGQVIAMDSPAARDPGEFNWGSTLWHEFTHVITLQTTGNRIPRWFSEGLSVYEERRARAGWGDNWSLQNLKAIKDGRFVKIDDLDSAFIRPKSPDGVAIAYFQASQVCEFIDEKFGFDAILKMLALYKDGARTTEALKQALQLTPEAFDSAFVAYIKGKTSGWIDAIGNGPTKTAGGQPSSKDELEALVKVRPNDYFAHLRLGSLYKASGDNDRAIEHLKRAIELFPYYAGEGNPYLQLADIYDAKGQKHEEVATLEGLISHNETNAAAVARLARLRLELGDKQGAGDLLRLSFYAQPFDPSLHKLAGDVYLELGRHSEAIQEFRVVVALGPADLAAAHYDVARALDASGNRVEAKKEVLRALEIAPGYDKALELLLKLKGGQL
jgi:tetratricopeptide (TPR) repeat protein